MRHLDDVRQQHAARVTLEEGRPVVAHELPGEANAAGLDAAEQVDDVLVAHLGGRVSGSQQSAHGTRASKQGGGASR